MKKTMSLPFFQSPVKLFLAILVTDFLCDIFVETLGWLFPRLPYTVQFLLDPFLTVVFLIPFLMIFMYRPLNRYMRERTLAEEALRESQRQLRHLSAHLLNSQEKERRRLSRELHDELGQSLTIMKLQLRSLKKGLREDQEEIKEGCEKVVHHIDRVVEDVRRLSCDLSPSIIEDLGLTAALRWLISNYMKTFSATNVTSDIMDIDHIFSEDAQVNIFRILQEALTNIGKHSEATNVSVSVKRQDDVASLFLEDDGRGFDITKTMKKNAAERGLGLSIMNERARMLGGDFDLWSQEGKGTRITMNIPVKGGGKG
jgi:signal transduction histidine kinase